MRGLSLLRKLSDELVVSEVLFLAYAGDFLGLSGDRNLPRINVRMFAKRPWRHALHPVIAGEIVLIVKYNSVRVRDLRAQVNRSAGMSVLPDFLRSLMRLCSSTTG